MRHVLLIIILVLHSMLGVRPLLAQQKDSVRELWLIRSQAITEDILKDATKLEKWDHPILLARLGQLWWQENPEKAKSWLSKAIEIVETVPNKENPTERNDRLAAARFILRLVAPLDQRLTTRLTGVLRTSVERSTEDERKDNAEQLIVAAETLAEKDAKRAFDIGRLALQIGEPTNLDSLLRVLRRIDPKLSDGLFVEALAIARATSSEPLIYTLTRTAFPVQMLKVETVAAPADNLRRDLLQLNLAWLRSNQITADNRNTKCGGIIAFILPVVAEFDRLLAQQAATAHQAISQCQSLSPLADQLLDDNLREQPLSTVDDILKAAADAEDVKVRAVFHYRAGALAVSQKDHERALKILDSMSEEERQFMGEAWISYRWHWAGLAAIEALKRGDIYSATVVIDAVPENLRVFTRIFFVRELPVEMYKEKDPTLTVLNDAVTGVRKSKVSDADRYGWYFALLGLILKYQPGDAASFLKESIATLNRGENSKEKTTTPERLDQNIFQGVRFLPESVTEIDEYVVKDALSSITSLTKRVQLRLEVLEASLKKMKQ